MSKRLVNKSWYIQKLKYYASIKINNVDSFIDTKRQSQYTTV